MDIVAPQVGVGRTPWRAIGIVVLLILAVAATIAYLGSRTTRLAPFYGPAANGSLIYDRLGDIYIADPDLRGERVLIGGDTEDIGMRWSLDGGTMYFGRIVDGRTVVMSSDPNGQNLRQLTTALPHLSDGVEVSPDGSRLVAISLESTPASLEVMPLDGSNTKRILDTGRVVPTGYVQWRPPDAQDIIFLGHPGGVDAELGLYRIHQDGTGLTELTRSPVHDGSKGLALFPLQNLVLSDDGQHAAYWNWEPAADPGRNCHVHLTELASGVDRMMTFDPTANCEIQPEFLGDGRIIFERQSADGLVWLYTAPVEGGTPSRVPGFQFHYDEGEWRLAPDRKTVLLDPNDGATQLIDIATGAVRDGAAAVPWDASWQRLAP